MGQKKITAKTCKELVEALACLLFFKKISKAPALVEPVENIESRLKNKTALY